MTETLEKLYSYLLSHKDESLTEVNCLGAVEGVTHDNVIQLLEILQDKGKISVEHNYIHYDITVF